MNRKVFLGAVAFLLLAFGVLLYASPYLTLRSIGKAVERQDAEAVSAYVDFPALRDSVKAQVLARMQPGPDQAGADNSLGGIGRMLATGVVNQLTDALVSPAGLMVMLKNGKPGSPADVAAAGVGVDTQPSSSRKKYTVDYQGWSQVFVHPEGEPSGFVFRREGLFAWRLAGLKMEERPVRAP
ncbi:DUF2939 domain-containing protein [Ottowia sp. GY511]|uniref:DUF2939 domain-containing protein n=1 Tax=Ottowia flava TaxID=2675430 RepID=A0ABW4KRM4_9BURK|nr:DUF2939 domain-containing protein [Ottowia sp. GY511]TXK26480.1 DUF2939 domain-containing protein [Ottowia sp. GY511]